MKYATLLASLALSVAPGALWADMRYSGFEVSFVDVEIDQGPFDVDGDGFEIAGSYEMNDRLFLFGEWQDRSLDFGIDGRAVEFGGGLNHAFTEDMDFVGTLSYVDAEVEVGGFTADDDGLALGAGIRSRIATSFEIDAGLKFVDFDESGSDTGFSLGGRYYFTEKMAVSLGADFNDNADTLRLGFRAEF